MDIRLVTVCILLTIVNLKCCLGGAEKRATKDQQFPKGFVWGAGTSSYQVEGAWNVDGKGESIWDNITHTYPEKIADRSNGDVSANSYKFYKDDVKALAMVGFTYYRFSISMSRVLPTGDVNNVNELGLQYYDNLINELLANGIYPIVTIFHWELPQKLQDIGGMLNPDIVSDLIHYAEILFKRFADRVVIWNTFNEPNIFCEFGYGAMLHAPFVNKPGVGPYLCAYHTLLANAGMYRLYKKKYNKKGSKMGIVMHCNNYFPKDKNKPEDIEAVKRGLNFWLGWFAKPIFVGGGYPQVMIDSIDADRLPTISESEKEHIKGTSDFFFLNYYTSDYVEMATEKDLAAWPTPSYDRDQNITLTQDENWPRGSPWWLYDVPEGLRELLNYIRKNFDDPNIIISENGYADHGEINDVGRINYLRGHLQAVLDAIDDGCRVLGHITWSLIDNFEWISGYTERFGLFHVNFDSPEKTRTPKNSVKFLQNVIATGRLPPK